MVNDGEVVAFDVTVKVTSTTPVSTEDAVTVTSWTDDLIAETRDLSSMDGISSGWYGDVYGFYTTGVEAEGALCDEEGIVEVPASGNVYKLPVAAKNAVALERYSDPVSLTIDGELATSQVNLLVFADTYDEIDVAAYIVYDDNSESDVVKKAIGGWEYETLSGDEAISGLGIVEGNSYDNSFSISAKNYRVYEMEVPADQYNNSPLKNQHNG